MAKKKQNIPAYGTAEINGVTYFRTRITDADGKRVPIYASTCEELYQKEQDARQQVQDILFRKQNPTVEDYCERWLLMRSATVTQDTLRNYRREMYKYILLRFMFIPERISLILLSISLPFYLMPRHCLPHKVLVEQNKIEQQAELPVWQLPLAVFG